MARLCGIASVLREAVNECHANQLSQGLDYVPVWILLEAPHLTKGLTKLRVIGGHSPLWPVLLSF